MIKNITVINISFINRCSKKSHLNIFQNIVRTFMQDYYIELQAILAHLIIVCNDCTYILYYYFSIQLIVSNYNYTFKHTLTVTPRLYIAKDS